MHVSLSLSLSLCRSWLVSEGYIDSPGEVPPGRCAPCGAGAVEGTLRLLQAPGEWEEEEEEVEVEEPPAGPAERPREASESGGSGLAPGLPSEPPPAAAAAAPQGPCPSPEPFGPETPILLLLSHFSQAEDPAPCLLSERSLRGLLDYLTLARPPSPRCARLLARLACNPNCLEALVRSRAVALVRAQLVHGLGPEALSSGMESAGGGARGARTSAALGPNGRNRELGEVLLRNLSVQAESPFGVGALTHLLLSGSESEKAACAIALPLLCRNESLRRKLLVDHGGLHLLLETLLTGGDPVVTFGAADAMATLAGAPGVVEEEPEPALKRPRMEEEGGGGPAWRCRYRELVGRGATDMHFALDDGQRLAASRRHVMRDSAVFGAMLGGGYLESRQSQVPLRGLAADVCGLFLHHLHGCQAAEGCPALAGLGLEPDAEPLPPFEASLLGRALAAAGQYLLSELGARLEEAAVSRQPPARLPAVYAFAERHSCPGLRSSCLRGLLQAPMAAQERAGAWGRLCRGAGEPRALLAALHALLLEHV
uniref:armadillo repeat-containing protein 5-like n=1 Tax=Pristiophorus japonicus TaxID=55135 RepID=UPI00398F591B